MRSTPFFWLSARITIWNCGLVKTPERAKKPGAAPLPIPEFCARRALRLLTESPASGPVPLPLRRPLVMESPPTTPPVPGLIKGHCEPCPGGMMVPPLPKTASEPGREKGPRAQSNPSSFRLFWEISTNLASISTWVGCSPIAASTSDSIRSKFGAVLRTTRRLLPGLKLALAPGGNSTPCASRKSLAPWRTASRAPPPVMPVSPPACAAGSTSAEGPPVIKPGGTLNSRCWRVSVGSERGTTETAKGSTFTFRPAKVAT